MNEAKKTAKKAPKRDAKKTGFSKSLVVTCKGDFKTFEKWFNNHYEGLEAQGVWDELQK